MGCSYIEDYSHNHPFYSTTLCLAFCDADCPEAASTPWTSGPDCPVECDAISMVFSVLSLDLHILGC